MPSDSDSVDPRIRYRANDVPSWSTSFLFAAQQMMCCISGLLVIPFVIADLACAGSATIALRVQLISTTFVGVGVATLLQTTFGLRLAVLQGPSFAFLPPLIAYINLPQNECNATVNDFVPESKWLQRITVMQGSLFAASLPVIFLGATGFVGRLAKLLGPITVCPILLLLAISTVDIALEKITEHWISLVQLFTLILFAIVLVEHQIPLPVYDFQKKRFTTVRARLFGLFPYLISISCVWLICLYLTISDLEPKEGKARVDRNLTMNVMIHSPWFRIPYPGQFGRFHVSGGLMLGFLASSTACVFETLGAYSTIARISEERNVPSSSVNRAVLAEGVGCCLAAALGICVGVTTYTENVALVSVTKVASRFTMQIAGVLLITLGVFSKVGAALATIPNPCIGAVLLIGMSMIFGVGLSTLQEVDLRISRNLTIIGTSILLGILIPHYFKQFPCNTGWQEMDQVLNILLNVPMFVGGLIAFFADNLIAGASREQRGLKNSQQLNETTLSDGYGFPNCITRALLTFPICTYLPFMPSRKALEETIKRSNPANDV